MVILIAVLNLGEILCTGEVLGIVQEAAIKRVINRQGAIRDWYVCLERWNTTHYVLYLG